MSEQTFIILGDPKGQPRHRSSIIAGHVHTYESKEGRENKGNIRAQVVAQKPRIIDKGKPVLLHIQAYMPRPSSHFGTGKNAGKLKESAPFWHTVKPDSDNILKAVKDALKGVCWYDDSQVCDERIIKPYEYSGISPRTVITIREMAKEA
jgi:Holliday junction resolvase RusA-like endonuclease